MILRTDDRQYRALLHAVNEARPGSETIRVSKTALWNLLRDHEAMNGQLTRRGEPATVSE